MRWRGVLSVGILAVVPLVDEAPVAAATGTVTGTVYRDVDGDGIRDAGELGVPGIVVAVGSKFGVTLADGTYSVAFTGVQRVRVVTGWYRSQCSSENCPVGAADNDFTVSKQYIIRDGVDSTLNQKLDVGLVPDWPGAYPQPTPASSANKVDVAARTSWIAGALGTSCNRGTKSSQRACKRGDRALFQVQVYNEGTKALTGIKARLELPAKHTFVSLVESSSPRNNPSITAVNLGTFDPVTRTLPFDLVGTLPPGASAQYVLSLTVDVDAPLSPLPLPTFSPYPQDAVTRVLAVDQGMAVDSDSAWCLDLTRACLGAHNKQVEPDHADYAGWNVIA